MKKLLLLVTLAGLAYAAYKHLEHYRSINADAWSSATDSFSGS